MRVLLVDSSDRGGIAAYTAALVEDLRAAGVDARLCAPPGSERGSPPLAEHRWGPEFDSASALSRRGRLAFEMLAAPLSVERALRTVRPDVVHFQSGVMARLEPLLIERIRRVAAVVITAHDPIPHEGGAAELSRSAARWRRADAVVIHGHEPLRLVQSSAGKALVRVIPSDLLFGAGRAQRLGREAARRRLGIHQAVGDEPFALLTGLLRPYKGIDLLARAWPGVAEARSGARLFVVGQAYGEARQALGELSRKPGVEVREGFIPDEVVDPWLEAANVVLLPYSHGSHSQVLHRAAEMGTPAIVSPPLAEELHRLSAGLAIPLDPRLWAETIAAALGPEPLAEPPLPTRGDTAAATAALYEELVASRR